MERDNGFSCVTFVATQIQFQLNKFDFFFPMYSIEFSQIINTITHTSIEWTAVKLSFHLR